MGLVGFPNAGKSTLLSVVSAAKPEIANYPFTTLKPNLGMIAYRDDRSFVMADIPGIIEGAAEGKGLGLRFLRHIERNPVLLFLVPADANDIRTEYETLLNELEKYNPDLLKKNRLLAVSKADMLDDELEEAMRAEIEDLDPIFFKRCAARPSAVERPHLAIHGKCHRLVNQNPWPTRSSTSTHLLRKPFEMGAHRRLGVDHCGPRDALPGQPRNGPDPRVVGAIGRCRSGDGRCRQRSNPRRLRCGHAARLATEEGVWKISRRDMPWHWPSACSARPQ